MKNVTKIIPYLFLLIFFLASCTGTPARMKITEADKLTDGEYQILLDMVRQFLVTSNLKLSGGQKAYIEKKDPVFRVHYSEHKGGRFSMTWEISDKLSVVIKGEGPFLKKSCRMRIALVRFKD